MLSGLRVTVLPCSQLLSTVLQCFYSITALVLTAVFLPQGTISVGVDATDLFDRYDEEYDDVSGSGFPQIEINKMHISQSIEVKHTDPSPSAAWA